MAGRGAGIGETAIAVVDELPVVAPVVQRQVDNAMGRVVEDLAGEQLGCRRVQRGSARTDDKFADAIGVVYGARGVQRREALVPVRVTVQDDVRAARVQVLPELLVGRIPAA